ncbi:MAG: DNA replication and repair protein RecF [Thermoanaerobaculia bacterium]|nr:DNA replication and repair protein RecF [Thermoanaerobaculia bacterium]
MLTHLSATAFRNLEALDVEVGPGRHLILGTNGAGKTSLLEAIYLLATTRSFRTPRIADCVRHGESSFRVLCETAERQKLEVFLDAGQRERRVNGERTSLADHLAALPVVCWTASEGEVLTGAPTERRRFMDRGVLGLRPVALEVMSRYRHALDGKKELLKSGWVDPVQLSVWTDLQARAAAELSALRATYVEQLSAGLAELLEAADLGLPEVKLKYRPSPSEAIDGVEAVRGALEQAQAKEIELKQPLLGPQRDDLSIRWVGREGESRAVKRVASAGERKALGLALLLAHGQVLQGRNVEPVVLLDDVDAELDPERWSRLWTLVGRHLQILVTSARPAVWEHLEIDHRWQVESGRVRRG